jgi:hypothetical protein
MEETGSRKRFGFAGSDFWELTVSLVERALLGTELETPKQIGLEFTS